jgi:hypothetical protein
MLTRVCKAVDWESGIELTGHLLGHLQMLQIHHIFPKRVLYQHEYGRPEVNAIANFTFLTQAANLWILDREPEAYFPEVEARHPGALASHWIPMDSTLWKAENYLNFLAARRELLAKAGNQFLDSLLKGGIPEKKLVAAALGQPVAQAPGEEDERPLIDLNRWVLEQGLPSGVFNFQLLDSAGQDMEILDLAWPSGLQLNLSQPVAVLPNGQNGAPEMAAQTGYRVFTNIDKFKSYVLHEVLARE